MLCLVHKQKMDFREQIVQKIKILDPQEAIKIAAGEVVERPSHILKELIENSIDAGATQITIQCKKAGKDLLSILDNGCGMSPQDARLCFAHHATSKITTVHDLESINTYGFRGEALSSIASVAKVQLTTKTDFDKSATQLTLQNGAIIDEQLVAHPTGTTLIITNLFDTIPARKKFLKSDDTEWNGIVAIFQAFCLRYPTIQFKLFHNDNLAYNCPTTTNILQRCAQLWSNELHGQLIEIDSTTKSNITISGATSKSHYHRYNRNQIFTFVNNRWVKNIELSRAIIKGYQNVLPSQKYPATFLFIDIDPKLVDINIHPKKEEVKFLHPGIMQTFIQETITDALNKSISEKDRHKYIDSKSNLAKEIENQFSLYEPSIQKEMGLWVKPEEEEKENVPFALNRHSKDFTDYPNPEIKTSSLPSSSGLTRDSIFHPEIKNIGLNQSSVFADPFNQQEQTPRQQVQIFDSNNMIAISTPSWQSAESISFQNNEEPTTNQSIYEDEPHTIIGQFNTTYILIEQAGNLILVDQHAAHERIIYEQLKKNFSNVATVQLLFPHIVKLSREDIKIITEHSSLFNLHGITLEQFSDTEIIIQSTPVSLQHKAIADIVHTTLAWIKEHQFIDKQDFFKALNESIHTQKACKTAVKAGDILNFEQMQNIVQTLFKTENRFCCPHGRPTMWNMSLKEIEKKFKRDYKSQQQISIYS